MNLPTDLNSLSRDQLRALAVQLIAGVQVKDREVSKLNRELHNRQTRIDQLSLEIAILKRQQFGRRSERLNSEQMSLLEEAIDGDAAAIETELDQLKHPPAELQREQPKRTPLPPQQPRTDIQHEPVSTACHCGCERERIGEDIS
jgi:transposase